ncbi:uncharacterized protein BKA78DRAFT_340422 [Phyllosticta capitalensis]|uniref:uncharacterized protein n=1 Tax=Phyllosticta capitalensis TaxID=121624 RepID=UPI003130F0EB
MTDFANFAIIHRGPIGASFDVTHIYEPIEEIYTYVASSIAIALRALSNDEARNWMASLVITYDQSRTGGGRICANDTTRAHNIVDSFLKKVQRKFPVICIDEKIKDPRCLGMHRRTDWTGNFDQFDPRANYVFLNAGTWYLLPGLAVNGLNRTIPNLNNSELEQFRTFQFTFAATLVHEVGAHLLITAIDNGRNWTPPEMSASGYVSIEEKEETGEWVYFGESGRWLEKNLYGGTLEFVQDPARDIKTQSGIPYLFGEDDKARRIERSVIDQFCRGDSTEFSFPLATDTRTAVDWRTVHRFGTPASTGSRNGRGNGPVPSRLPQEEVQSRKDGVNRYMSARGLTAEVLAGKNIAMSALMRIPMHPQERLTAVA